MSQVLHNITQLLENITYLLIVRTAGLGMSEWTDPEDSYLTAVVPSHIDFDRWPCVAGMDSERGESLGSAGTWL